MNKRDVKAQFKEKFVPYQKQPFWFKATVGRSDGTILVPSKPGFIYVTDFVNIVHEALNNVAPTNKAGVLVRVGYDTQDSSRLVVLSLVNPYSQSAIQPVLGHHTTHEWLGPDMMNVYGNQIIPALVRSKSGTDMTISIYPFMLKMKDGTFKKIDYQEQSLAAYIPSSGALWVTIAFDTITGALSVQPGTAVASRTILARIPVPEPTTDTIPAAAVSVYAGQSAVVQSSSQDDVRDLRWLAGAGGGGGGASAFIDLTDVPSSYTGQAGKVAKVKGDETGLEFGDAASAFIGLTDVPASYAGQAGKMVSVNGSASGLVFTSPATLSMVKEDWSDQVDGLTDHFTTDNEFLSGTLVVFDMGLGTIVQVSEDVTLDGFTLDYIPAVNHRLFGFYLQSTGGSYTPVTSVNGDTGTVVVQRQVVFAYEGEIATIPVVGGVRIPNTTNHPLTIEKVRLDAGTPPGGQAIICDIHLDGVTIFTNQAHRPQIADGANTGETTTIDVPNWAPGHYLTFDIDQRGITPYGSNIVATVLCKG